MGEYDVVLKELLQGSADIALRQVTGSAVARWLSPSLPEVRETHADLLGEREDGTLVHIELQSTNDPKMALRMAEYYLRVYRLFGRFPDQTVLYVGRPEMRMAAELVSQHIRFQYRLIDARELDGTRLLQSAQVGDNVIAVLAGWADQSLAAREIVRKIAVSEDKRAALKRLLVLAGLRGLEKAVEQEASRMPITEDIMNHAVIGRERRRGMREEALELVTRLIVKRFGAAPSWTNERLSSMPTEALEEVAVGLLDAKSLEELLKP